jgi:hypothetical protein
MPVVIQETESFVMVSERSQKDEIKGHIASAKKRKNVEDFIFGPPQ